MDIDVVIDTYSNAARLTIDFLAYAPELKVFGEGDTEHEAMDDLRANVLDLAEQLGSSGSELAERWRQVVGTTSDLGCLVFRVSRRGR